VGLFGPAFDFSFFAEFGGKLATDAGDEPAAALFFAQRC